MTNEAPVIPNHVGFIMDGNRRWARGRGLPVPAGHLAGYESARRTSEFCFERGVKFVTLYTFSTENWKREVDEVGYLMKLLARAVSAKEVKYALKKGTRLRFLGRREGLDPELIKGMVKAEAATKDMPYTLAICLNYGGQQEIVDAAKQCLRDGLTADDITSETIADRLYEADIPPIDLVVRTSGEQRISNFMLWRVAYSEFLFLKKHWPDMTKADVTAIIEEYGQRSRRFGG